MEQEGDSPGDGVRDVQTLGRVELRQLENGHDPADADAADADHREDHGNEGFSQAPQGAGGHIHHTADKVEQADDGKPDHTPLGGFRRIRDVQRQQEGASLVNQTAQDQAGDGHTAQADAKDLRHTLVLPCAGILTDEVYRRLVEGVQGGVDEAFNIAGGCVTGHHHVAEGIDGGLDHHVGNGKQGALQTGRQTDGHHLDELDAVEAQLFQLQTACIGALHQDEHNHHSGKALGNGGRQGNACHIHVQHRDEDDIQRHIDHTGDGEEDQRAFGIACGPEDRSGEVVDHREGDARKIDPDIYRGQG